MSKNPKIENISSASSLGSNTPPTFLENMKEDIVLKTPEGMITPPEGISDHMSERDFRKLGKYPIDKIMKNYGAKNYIPEVKMDKDINPAVLRKKLYGIPATKIQAAVRGRRVRERAKKTKKLVDGLKRLFGGRPKKTRKRKRRKKTRKRRKRKTKKRRKKRRYTKRIPNVKEILSDKCSPKKEGEILKFTCYTKSSLYKLKNIWNARHSDVKITTNDPKSIWDFLSSHMADTCERESCWLKKNWINQKLPKSVLENTFAPEQPKSWKRKPTEWLTSIDILDVMKQYEKTYKNFEFMGPSPIDFDTHKLYGECVWEELCKISLKELKSKGKDKIGIIFNTDKHTEPGSHWVAMFIDCKKKSIYYFDSYADDAPKEIKVLGKRLQKQSEEFGKRYKYIENKKRHQWSNSECGMYCLFFIIELLKGRSFNKIESKRIDDKFMKKLRNIYFNKI